MISKPMGFLNEKISEGTNSQGLFMGTMMNENKTLSLKRKYK